MNRLNFLEVIKQAMLKKQRLHRAQLAMICR